MGKELSGNWGTSGSRNEETRAGEEEISYSDVSWRDGGETDVVSGVEEKELGKGVKKNQWKRRKRNGETGG